MDESLGHKAVSGAMWATIDRLGAMTLQFVVNLILANLLLPADFGAIGMLAIFIAVSQALVDGGFGSALIQKKTPTQTDYSTVFYWNIAFSCILYLVLFASAPGIAYFFNMPELCGVLRCIGLTVIFGSVTAIQTTRLKKSLAFRTIAIANLSSLIAGAVTGIVMALNGFGVWSLVSMQVCGNIMSVLLLWLFTRWFRRL